MTAIEFRPVIVPRSADAPDAADFLTMVEIRNRVQATYGDQGIVIEPAQGLPSWQDQTDERITGFLIVSAGSVVGRAVLYEPMEKGSVVARPVVEVLPEHRGRGVGRSALAHLERLAAERGRTVLTAWTQHLDTGESRLEAATGAGSVPRDGTTRFLLAGGYALEQVERTSALDLTTPSPAIDALLENARAAASGYRYLSWTLPTPPAYADDYAYLKSRMSTDAPSAGLAVDEESWDAARIARVDEVRRRQGFFFLVGAAQHIETGRLVAFTELAVFGPHSGKTLQYDTLVQSDHRGHRLGMLVKGETLARWRTLVPESSRIVTGNAEENRPMLDVNEAMGFVPIAYEGAWQKRLEGEQRT